VLHDGQIVRDEDVGDAQIALQRHEQVDDLRLNGHVQRRHREKVCDAESGCGGT
jgi:hypothetical protein